MEKRTPPALRCRLPRLARRRGEALQDTTARAELARLTDHVAQRLRLLALNRGQRGNLGWPQDRFVGREPELRRLRERLLDAAPSAPVALIGIGGIGKTALALTFAFQKADAFLGGRWLLRCEGRARLDSALRPLVQDLAIELTDDEKLDDTLAARRVLDTLRPRGPALFLLDNVDTPALLAPDSLALLSGERGIRLLVTTRLAPGAFAAAGATVTAIDLDQLPEDHALDLIRLYQPDAAFASAADENDAREIVRALGGLTLAVETAAVYLGQNDPRVADPRYAVRISDYLEDLRRDIAGAGAGSAMSQLREVAATIRPTLARLDAPARTILQLAALLPPDSLPLPWLRAIAGEFHPSLATDAAIAERDAWTDLIRALIGMRLLHQKGETPVLTIHRLLQRVLDTELSEQRDGLAATLDTHLGQRADALTRSQNAPADWELDALLVALPARLGQNPAHSLAHHAVFLTDKIVSYRTLPAAAGFLATVHEVLARLAAADPANAAWQRDLSVSFERLGDLATAQGNLPEAGRHFAQCHATLRGMRESNMHLDASVTSFLARLEQAAPQNYAGLVAAAASSSATAPPRPPPRITIPDPLAQPRRELSTEELRESARFNFGKRYWEAAALELQKLLARGDPIEELAPKIVTCLLNAHENLMAHDAATIEDLLRRLESAGHPTLAADLRRQFEAKQPKPKKPWWKLW